MRDAPSRTAELVALCRASDQLVPGSQRILDDPWAAYFLNPLDRAALRGLGLVHRLGLGRVVQPSLLRYILARHRWLDETFVDATNFEQYVILGAGYDTRAFRFAEQLEGRTVFELDFPATAQRKRRILEELPNLPPVDRRALQVDFRVPGWEQTLLASGYQGDQRSLFVWEGVSMYLTRQAVEDTLSLLRRLAATDSVVALDFWHFPDAPDMRSSLDRLGPVMLHLFGEPITFGLHPGDVEGFLSRLGWSLEAKAEASDFEARWDRGDFYPHCYVVKARAR